MTISTFKRPVSYLLSTCLIVVGANCMAISANAADKVLEFTVEKKGEVDNSQIAFVPFSGDEAVSAMILDKLRIASISATTKGLVDYEAHSSRQLQGALTAWQQLGIPYLVVGNTNGNRVTFEVIDVASGRALASKYQPSRTLQSISTNSRQDTATKAAARIYEIIKGKKSDLDAKIVYIEETGVGKNKTSSLFIRDADGGNPRELTRVTNASIFSPAASPDGRYIAYSVQFEKNHANLYRLDLLNPKANPVQLVNLKGSNLSPSYSPDGSTILFSSSADGDADIYQVSSSGGRARKVLDLPYEQVQPSYAPDGRSFFFGSDHSNPGNIGIYRSSFSDSLTKISRRGYSANPNVSPDGTKIGYLSGRTARVMDTSGNNIASFGNTGLDESPSMSPSSERVVYSQGKGNSTIVISSLTGGPTITRRANGIVRSPIWVPSID